MSDTNDQPVASFDSLVQAPVGRRTAMRRMAVASVAPAIAGSGILGFATAASATPDSGLNARKLRYAIHGGKVIDGYFAAPRGKSGLDVVVVIHDRGGLDAKAEDTARRYALGGYYAIAPDLGATFKGADHEAMVAEMVKTAPNLKRFAHGNGKVTVVSA